MQPKPLNVVNVKTTATNVARFVQNEKIELARTVIARQQYAGRWPEEYISYSGPVGRNSFKDPETFFRVMSTRHQNYRQRFTFLPASPAAAEDMLDAAELAYELVVRQAYRYGKKTGAYRGSFVLFAREGASRKPLSSLSQLESPGKDTVFEILSPLAYSSTVEVNALYMRGLGGVMYYAAQKVSAAYPGLGVRYVYHKAAAFNLPHKYDVPVLSIGMRTAVQDRLAKPGKNYRRRARKRI